MLAQVDVFQQKHSFVGFPFAVIKKYGDDESGYQAALVTYYSFLSLFPLLIVAISVIDLVSQHNMELRHRLTDAIGNYFPSIGDQLRTSVHGSKASGITLVIGLLFTLYGSKGSADAIRHALDHAWEVPRKDRPGFPKNTLKSLGLMVGGGLGLIISAFLSSYATATLGHSLWFRVVPIVLSLGITYLVFIFVYKIGTARKHVMSDIRLGALMASVALLILQTLGGVLVKHQLHNAHSANAQFAVVLVLLFWIYLQAQVFMYTVQLNVVHALKLWPRSLTGKPLTKADQKALTLYIKREKLQTPPEHVAVEFNDKAKA